MSSFTIRKTWIYAVVILVIGIVAIAGVVFSTNLLTQAPPSELTDQVVVPITGSSGTMSLSCGKTTIFEMDNGGTVSFPKIEPCDLSVIIKPIEVAELPSSLPEETVFLDATTVTVVQDGIAIDTLPANKKVTISFAKHAQEIDEKPMYVLHWSDNGEDWQDVAFDSHLMAYSNETGVFVLVKR